MATDEPPYLTIGTDVSAKYKGAFCEAKIKKVNRIVKCKIGAEIDAKHPEKGQFMEAVINKVQDYSQYTVVFDDGDETTLRRTSLCLKSGRHFAESPTLDQFPLTNPEHFSSPVIGTSKLKRKRRSTMNSSLDYESSDDENIPRKVRAIRDKEQNPDLGKVSTIKISKDEHLIRSFKDGKYYQVPKRDIREFIKDAVQKVENNSLRLAVEKATNYLEKDELPPHWDKALFAGLDSQSADEESHDSDSDTSDDEPSEEKDRFVAQLYKFMDERGTPINKAPVVSNRDLNLYKLFRIMHKLGGYNKVTNKNKWKTVYTRMGLPQSNLNGPNQIKVAYKRFLQSFEDFYRKLGCTMVSNSRSTRGRHRSDRNIMVTRTRERDTASPKGRNTKDSKEKTANEKKADEKPKVPEKKEAKQEDTSKAAEKPKSPEKKRIEKSPDDKDSKQKKEEKEKPRLVRSQSLTKDKKETKPEKARTREDARKEKNESPEKKGTRSNTKIEPPKKEKEETPKDKKEKLPKEKDKKEEKPAAKDIKDEKPKIKKEDKLIRDRKALREKKVEEKSPKEKRENPPREKRERDSSREDKGSPKVKKEDSKVSEEKSPKRKIERPIREKIEEKSPKTRLEDKAVSAETNKKPVEDSDAKSVKEEKPIKSETDVKKEEIPAKEKLRPKLRDRKEDNPTIGDEIIIEEAGDMEETDGPPQEELEKKMKLKSEEGDEPPCKSKRRSMKSEDKEDKESLQGMSDSDESFTNDSEKNYGKEIDIGDRVKVKYGRGRLQKVYEAKVLKIDMEGPEKRYYVHYAGWNTRYDEWVKKSYIVACISNNKKGEQNLKNSLSAANLKKIDRGKPPGISNNAKLDRKNSTSSISSRATRSEKKGSLPLSGGLEPKKRTRKKSGTMTSTTDVSQESDTDGADLMDLDDDDAENSVTAPESLFKEELFSDDEEKEKLEDVKRGDITKLEKAISVEESVDDSKDLLFCPILEGNNSPFKENVSTTVEKTENMIKEENSSVKETNENAESNLNCDKLPRKPEENLSSNAECEFVSEADVSFPSNSLPEIKIEKTPETDMTGSLNNSAVSPNSAKLEKNSPKVLAPTESKAALSFAGLIQKSTTENIVSSPSKTTTFCKIISAESISSLSTTSVEKLNLESRSITSNIFKSVSMFGSIMKSPPQCTASTDTFDEKFNSKPTNNIFSGILKSDDTASSQISDLEPVEKPKSQDSSHNIKISDPLTDSSKATPQESNVITEMKKEPESKPLKFCSSNIEEIENKSKDKFDILLQNTSNFGLNPQKLPEMKNNIFDFSFGTHAITSESLNLQPLPSTSTTSLSRIQTKSSDTVDLSRMIPGILERLEKDVVTDSKESVCLPPPKEELGFDFLRGSQNISKPLSCSDSSNSLKICESDTNDSNTESKDLVINEKLEMPVIVPPDTCSSSLDEKGGSIQIPEVVSETSLLTSSSASVSDTSKEKVSNNLVTSQLASVITAATIAAPVLEIIPPTNKDKETDILKIPILPQENIIPPKDNESPLSDSGNSLKNNAPADLSPELPVENSSASLDIVAEKEDSQKKEPVENVPDMNVKSEKEALVEEIRTISSYAQSSVIKCVASPVETKNSDGSESPALNKDVEPEVKQEVLEKKESCPLQTSGLDAMADAAAIKEDSDIHNVHEEESNLLPDTVAQEGDQFSQMSKKDIKKKRLGKKIGKKLGSSEILEKEDKDLKLREGKSKSKKRLRMETNDGKNLDLKSKSKKLKKNKNKKRFSRHEDQFGDAIKKFEFKEDDHRDSFSDKIRKKEKKRNEKKFLKCGIKHEDFLDNKGELCKKKKNKKNRDKFVTDKKDFFEKKTKKKRKCHMEDNQDTDSEKESPPKLLDKKRKKERKKFKVKDCSSSDDAAEKFFKEKSKDVASTSSSLMRQDSKSDDPDMSFLLCEEKVPASPAEIGDDSSGSSSNEEGDTLNSGIDLLPSGYPCSSREPSNSLHKHNIDNVLDNTPPTTPSSTESLLSSSPSHERDSFPVSYAENTQSGEGESDLFHVSTNRTVAHGSEEYRAATTLAFAVCKSVSEKPKDEVSQGYSKSPRSDHSPSKRKKKRVQRYSESVKSPKHKSSFTRMSKVESYCEDSSGTSPATSSSPPYSSLSSLNFSKSLPHRLSNTSESSRYFYIPLHEKDPEKRIAVLQDKMAALRKKYLALRAEVIAIDHKRRKARKKIKESGGSTANPSVQSEDGQSCS
ncbi:AT-rich interactive domain-containing protein like [Argiope bruennichi]|uniref:AT-rich interactive domain-containing protein like n=1 Tax=Argiope bruennichi TaxID=94029 RepID=A0A8T0FAH3_ARGBR|nr:AT-rich interactive domain-containing protein like [Argiope bruennichi]